jgi:hypothetical protein
MSIIEAICWGLAAGFAMCACSPAAARSTLARAHTGPWRRAIEGAGPYLLRDLAAWIAAWLVVVWLLPSDPDLETALVLALAAVLLLRGGMLVEAGARISFIDSELPQWHSPREVVHGFLRRPHQLVARVAILVPVVLLVGGGAGGGESILAFGLGIALGFLGLVGIFAVHRERRLDRGPGPYIVDPWTTRMVFSLAGLILFAGAFLLVGRTALERLASG